MNKFRWVELPSPNSDQIHSLSSELNNLHPSITSILINRGIDTFEKAKNYFRPQIESLNDPMLMKDMDVAVSLVNRAIEQGSKILLYGDYDVDGTTSVAMLYAYLVQFSDQIEYYIPDRYSEGYGISQQGMEYAHENGVQLIISLDCGIKAMNTIQYAVDQGIEFVVCDHHEPGEKLPPANAVLDPKRSDCKYPYKELSGCGVGFKLMEAIELSNKRDRKKLNSFLDLVTTSIAADIVPITGENRLLAYFGMRQINEQPRPGLQALIDVSELKRKLNINDLVFRLAPRINAAGRLESGRSAVDMLVSSDLSKAKNKAKHIQNLNLQRRELDADITDEALEMLKNENNDSCKTTVIYQPHWHKGVIGIVASRLIEKYYKPTIVLTRSNGLLTGSVRSVQGYDVYKALTQCEDFLEQYGGHKYAAGVTLKEENLAGFKQKFEEVVKNSLTVQSEVAEIVVDAYLPLTAINKNLYNVVKQLGPFGPGNQNPIFKTDGLLGQEFRIVGDHHLKLKVFDPQQPNVKLSAIGFGLAEHFDKLDEGVELSLAYHIDENFWNGRSELQLVVKDLVV